MSRRKGIQEGVGDQSAQGTLPSCCILARYERGFLSSSADPVQRFGLHVERTAGGECLVMSTSFIHVMYSKYMRGVDTHNQLCVSFSTQI